MGVDSMCRMTVPIRCVNELGFVKRLEEGIRREKRAGPIS